MMSKENQQMKKYITHTYIGCGRGKTAQMIKINKHELIKINKSKKWKYKMKLINVEGCKSEFEFNDFKLAIKAQQVMISSLKVGDTIVFNKINV